MNDERRSTFYEVCRPPAWLLSTLFFRLRYYARENVPQRGGVLILSNHQSYADPVLLSLALRRQVTFMARGDLFQSTLFGALIRSLGAIPVHLERPTKDSIRQAIELLVSGRMVAMFPEGARTPDGRLQPVKGGFRIIVARARVPVVPVGIDGAYESWPRWRLLPMPGRVRIAYGAPIAPEEFDGLSTPAAAERVHGAISALVDWLRRLP